MFTKHHGIRGLLAVAPIGKNIQLTTALGANFGTLEVLEATPGDTHPVGTLEVLTKVG